ALRQNCRIDLAARSSRPLRPPAHDRKKRELLAARSSRPLRPPAHDRKKREAEAPRSRRPNELAADLTDKRLASSRPRSSEPAYPPAWKLVLPGSHISLCV